MIRSRFALGALAGGVAAVLVLAATRPYAPGLALDGVAYVSAAESLVRTRMLRMPFSRWPDADSTSALSRWPPGTSLLIAASHALGVSAMDSARLMLVACAFATLLGVVLVTAEAAGATAALLAATLAIVTPDLGHIHRSVWSEAPFVACVVALLAALVLAPDRALRHGLIAAAAGLLRYAGVALSIAVTLWAVRRQTTWRSRLRAATLASFPGIVVQAWWAWRNAQEDATARTLQFVPLDRFALVGIGRTVRAWLVPAGPHTGMAIVIAATLGLAGLALLAHALRRVRAAGAPVSPSSTVSESRLYAAANILAASYFAVLLAARIFADPWIAFEGRHLVPLMLLAEICIAAALAGWWHTAHRGARAAAVATFGVWTAVAFTTSVAGARPAMHEGLYMSHSYWRNAGVLEWVRREGSRVPLYSNYPSAIYAHTRRSSREIPLIGEVRHVRQFGATLVRSGGVFVAFHPPSPWLLPNDEVARFLAFREVARFADGVIWAPSPTTPR
jgi:hypothetical protein